LDSTTDVESPYLHPLLTFGNAISVCICACISSLCIIVVLFAKRDENARFFNNRGKIGIPA